MSNKNTRWSINWTNCSWRLGRALILNSVVRFPSAICTSTKEKISFITLDRGVIRKITKVWQMKCFISILRHIQVVLNSLLFTLSKDQKINNTFKWKIALANSTAHIIVCTHSLFQLTIFIFAVFCHVQCYWDLQN